MIFRSLDGIGDWNFGFGKQSYAIQDNAIALDVKTRILSFLKDCWFAPSAGIDWLTILGTKSTQQQIQLTVRGTILQSYGVTKVNSINANVINRHLTITYDINTIFSKNQTQIVEVI